MLPMMRTRRTSKQYNVLAEALSALDRFDELDSLVKEMKSDGILAGRTMRESIAKLRSAGFVESTDEYVDELAPNAKIGCVVDESDEETDDDDDEAGDEITVSDRIRLKPWLDPISLTRALNGWDPSEVKALESAGFVWTPRLVCKILRSFRKPEPAWEFFCWVSYQPGDFTHNPQTVSRMIATLARSGHVELIERLLSKLKSEQILLPFATIRLAIDFYGLSKKPEPAIKLYRSAESICGPLTQTNRVLLCSSLLRTVVKCRRKYEAMELLEEMMGDGVLLDIQTFSGLMQFFAEEGDLKSVHKLFGLVRQCGLEPDGYMYRVLIRAYCKNERAVLGLRVFEEMRSLGLVLDRGTKGLLVKSLWKEGKLREAAAVEERFEGLGERIPTVLPGHVWTVSEADFRRVCDIYSGCFKRGES
ncbi:uncharacterized protein A4U43_C07F19960 [Asparagus officinalis]|uniref:Pentacotripeptide-repeat region of PRORP domain-containing protein n=1 Tax=Asparagus officinalis TaxID=4686 RepID=A0A5P1EDD4_ASPOF|nr:pentatricopeptide repeat-containing protein At5g66631 [Asparagus officinalis]XP_020273534.1 pentatricopeptide repeat-containing protein At5g66631 [Asparagus officinalis]XP_020273535.1 pentatricopeptide repeat-containing protein At5g66631 [Asparagus officinalis]ONK63888.1 uncharacterized protein A4U43_C07F19960 [Asparagus officinalis]